MPAGWLKGQLHAHSSGSGDSKTPASDVHRWYEERDYDFVVFTDHNAITDTPDTARLLTMPGVELTRNLRSGAALHINALFTDAADAGRGDIDFGDIASTDRREIFLHEMKRTKELGGIAMLNHPNLRYGTLDQALVFDLAREGLSLIEIANQAWDSNNAGDAEHPSTEALWDAALARGHHLFATATDDAHHYDDAAAMLRDGERPFDGDHGFVGVRSAKDPASIRAAIAKGDFYASTGVVFTRYEVSGGTVTIDLERAATFEVIALGRVVRRERGDHLVATLSPDDGPYLRVRVTRDDGAVGWTQAAFR